MWISYFGTPKQSLCDRSRGVFNNEGYQQMNEKLNIETYTTATEVHSAMVMWNAIIW